MFGPGGMDAPRGARLTTLPQDIKQTPSTNNEWESQGPPTKALHQQASNGKQPLRRNNQESQQQHHRSVAATNNTPGYKSHKQQRCSFPKYSFIIALVFYTILNPHLALQLSKSNPKTPSPHTSPPPPRYLLQQDPPPKSPKPRTSLSPSRDVHRHEPPLKSPQLPTSPPPPRDLHQHRPLPKSPQPPYINDIAESRWHYRRCHSKHQPPPPLQNTKHTHSQPTHTAHIHSSAATPSFQRYATLNSKLLNTQHTPSYIHTITTHRNLNQCQLPQRQQIPHKNPTNNKNNK